MNKKNNGVIIMTSELVILTPSAVALAADSAVTLDTIENRKIYNGINKLFMLSNEPPVGIMTYNNVRLLNIPFETLIKEFRKSISQDSKKRFKNIFNNKQYSTLNEFKVGFDNFLKGTIPRSDFRVSFNEKLDDFIKNFIPSDDNLNQDFYNRLMNLVIPNEIMVQAVLDSFTEDDLENIKRKAVEIHNKFENKLNMEKFVENFIKFFIWEEFANNYTGIVLAGFEMDKLFPSCMDYKIIYLYDDKFVSCDSHSYEVSKAKDGDVAVIPFAQHEVIQTFLRSIDSDTKSKIIDYFIEINAGYAVDLIKAINNNPNIDEDSKKEVLMEITKFNINNIQLNNEFSKFILNLEYIHVAPILRSIGALPYGELSNLCESLIKITSLKRKVQSDLETVGGDVDVAIITKGDGFIWTKRKHYFDGNLNHQFFEKKNNEKI